MTTTAASSIHPMNGIKSGKKSNGRKTYKIAIRGIASEVPVYRVTTSELMERQFSFYDRF